MMGKKRVRRSKKVNDKGKEPSFDGEGVIVLKNLKKKFGEHLVLNNVSLTIEKNRSLNAIKSFRCFISLEDLNAADYIPFLSSTDCSQARKRSIPSTILIKLLYLTNWSKYAILRLSRINK